MHQLIIFGPPGVGKGTQAKLLAEKLKLNHFSTGDILRKAGEEGTELGKQAKTLMDAGELVPDSIMIGIVKEALESAKGNGFILDGFPRTLEQAEALDKMLSEMNIDNVKALYLTADDDEVVERLLKRGRSDDTEETIRYRLNVYRESTAPVIEFFKNKGNVLEIDGVGEIEEINGKAVELITG